jgi:hypothetical protein
MRSLSISRTGVKLKRTASAWVGQHAESNVYTKELTMSINNTDFEYEYMGYQYRVYRDVEEDNIKNFHECWKDGRRVNLGREFENTSPYRWVKKEDFMRYVDAQLLVDFARV